MQQACARRLANVQMEESHIVFTLANCLEIQTSTQSRGHAAGHRTNYSDRFPSGQLPSTCSICLEALHLDQTSEDSRTIVLPGCLHAFHLVCLGEWRCQSTLCPECRSTLPALLGQMLMSGFLLSDNHSPFGAACKRICEKLQAMQATATNGHDLGESASMSASLDRAGAQSILQQLGGDCPFEVHHLVLDDIYPEAD